MAAERFTLQWRERFLALLAVGFTVERAAAEVGISPVTVRRWAALGRAPGALEAHRAFALRLDAVRAEAEEQRRAAAAEELPEDHPAAWVAAGDPFVGISPDELAMLSPEEQERARKVTSAALGSAEARGRRNGSRR